MGWQDWRVRWCTATAAIEVSIPAESVDDAFEARLVDFMQKMTSPVPPRRVPSGPECGFCELTDADCPEKIEPKAA